MQDKIKEVIEKYEGLPKSTNDEGEFVIIAENNQGGGYEEYKECLGVNKEGQLIWSYLSGCSCSGSNDNKTIEDVTAKMFRINSDENTEEFYQKNKIEPYVTSYCSY